MYWDIVVSHLKNNYLRLINNIYKISINHMSSFTAGVIVIGDEILSGRTQDTNSNYIAKKLLEAGIKLEDCLLYTSPSPRD